MAVRGSQHGAPLRVAVVHSFYASDQPSGENRVVEQQVKALERAGVRTLLVAEATDDRRRNPLYPLEAGLTVSTGWGRSPLGALRDFEPDVTHVHNLFPNFGRNWVRSWSGPLVAHAHNYRPLCPAGTLYRDGKVCTECLDERSSRPAVRHRCYRNSLVHTVPLALSTRFAHDVVLSRADRLITLTGEMGDLYVRGGVPEDRIDVVHNFIPPDMVPEVGAGGDYWLYAGRLTAEKGILPLVRSWPRGQRLLVAGSGPQLDEVRAAAGPAVEVLGHRDQTELRELMSGALGLVFPSRWLEGLGLVALEALAVGTPVLAWRPAPAARLVEDLGVGSVGGTDLAQDLEEAAVRFPALRAHCRSVFDATFTEAAWLRRISEVYARAKGSSGEPVHQR